MTIQAMINSKNRLRREYQLAPRPEKREQKRMLNKESKAIGKANKKHNNHKIKSKLSGFRQFDTRLHHHVSQLLEEKRNIPLLLHNNDLIYLSSQNAKVIADTLGNVHTMNRNLGSETRKREIEAKISTHLESPLTTPECSVLTNVEEVSETLRKLQTRKAPDQDGTL